MVLTTGENDKPVAKMSNPARKLMLCRHSIAVVAQRMTETGHRLPTAAM